VVGRDGANPVDTTVQLRGSPGRLLTGWVTEQGQGHTVTIRASMNSSNPGQALKDKGQTRGPDVAGWQVETCVRKSEGGTALQEPGPWLRASLPAPSLWTSLVFKGPQKTLDTEWGCPWGLFLAGQSPLPGKIPCFWDMLLSHLPPWGLCVGVLSIGHPSGWGWWGLALCV
jgi:hypothetical protein